MVGVAQRRESLRVVETESHGWAVHLYVHRDGALRHVKTLRFESEAAARTWADYGG